MTFFGSEKPVEYGPQSLFDPTMAQMVLNARNNYINAMYQDYLRSREDLKEFNEKYADFSSLSNVDTENYYNEYNKVKEEVDKAYQNGDLLRTSEGRARLGHIMASVNTQAMARAKKSGQMLEDYNKAAMQMKANNTYNDEFNRWYLTTRYGINNVRDWDSNNMGVFGEASPQQYQDITQASRYITDGLQKGLVREDDQYEYWGKSKDDVELAVLGALPSLTSDYWQYQRQKAYQEAGLDPNVKYSQEDLDEAFAQYLVNARAEDYGTLERREKPEYTRQREYAYEMQGNKDKAALNYYYGMLSQGVDPNDPEQVAQYMQQMRDERAAKIAAQQAKASKYLSSRGGGTTQNYSLPEELHHDGLYSAEQNLNIPVYQLMEDANGNLVPAARGENGQLVPAKSSKEYIRINPDNASWEELEFAANAGGGLMDKQIEFAQKQAKNRPYSFIFDPKVQNEYLKTFGYHINSGQIPSIFPTKKVNEDGSIILSSADIKNLRGMAGIIADSAGSRANYKDADKLNDVLPPVTSGTFGDNTQDRDYVLDKLNENKRVQASFVFDDTSDKNIMMLVGDDGETQIWIKGSVTYITGENAGKQTPMSTRENVWMPTNIKSNKAVPQKFSTSRPWVGNFGLNSKYRSAYDAMAAHYAKATGSQKTTNIALQATEE